MTDIDNPVAGVIEALRAKPLDFEGDLTRLRTQFEALGSCPQDPAGTAQRTGDVPVLVFEAPSGPVPRKRGAVMFLHSGGYVAGTARGSAALAMALATATGRTVVSVDYSLAPEAPFPAARDEALAVYRSLSDEHGPGRVALVGASAGGGIAVQMLLELRAQGVPMPAAVAVVSPFVDLTLSGSSYERNAERDPSLTRRGLEAAASHYAATKDAQNPASGSLSGLPPMQIHVGSLEILLSDSVDLAAGLGAEDVHVELEVWPGMVHVFPTFAARIPQGVEALRRIGAHMDRWMRGAD